MLKNDSFYNKIKLILFLSSSLVFVLTYLLFSGKAENLQSFFSDSTEVATISPTITPSPEIIDCTPTIDSIDTKVDVKSDTSYTRIVNLDYPISENYVPTDLVVVDVNSNGEQLLRKDAADQLSLMFNEAKQSGYDLYLVSAYRSYTRQKELYDYYVDERGVDEANRIDCHPGASEHQLGLAVDLGTSDHVCQLATCFDTSQAYQWLIDNSYKFGYILRYPNEKENITYIKYSPWNFRYIGVEEAKKIHESNLTMEEYYSSELSNAE